MTKFILSIDGGGIRGIIPAAVLTVLTEKLAKRGKTLPLHRYFHLIAGTSTGAIIAAGSPARARQTETSGGRSRDLARSLQGERTRDLQYRPFPEDGQFRRPVRGALQCDALERILQELLGKTTEVKDALAKVLITAYDIHARRAVFITNADKDHERFYFWQAVRGSSAAPTYFEPALVEDIAQDRPRPDALPAPDRRRGLRKRSRYGGLCRGFEARLARGWRGDGDPVARHRLSQPQDPLPAGQELGRRRLDQTRPTIRPSSPF